MTIKYKYKKKAFSVAEAMITLLIASLALAATAPIFTKRAKSSSTGLSATEVRALVRQELQESFGDSVVFFSSGDYPPRWEEVSTTENGESLSGRYLRVAGNYTQLNPDGTQHGYTTCAWGGNENAPTYDCTYQADGNREASVFQTYNDKIRNIQGALGSVQHAYAPFDKIGGAFERLRDPIQRQIWGTISFALTEHVRANVGYGFYGEAINASYVVPTGDENTPYSIALKACRYVGR